MRHLIKTAALGICCSVILNPAAGIADSLVTEKSARGFWNVEDCKKVSDHSGAMLYLSGELLKQADAERKKGNKDASDELSAGAIFLSELSANAAKNFEAFCKG